MIQYYILRQISKKMTRLIVTMTKKYRNILNGDEINCALGGYISHHFSI